MKSRPKFYIFSKGVNLLYKVDGNDIVYIRISESCHWLKSVEFGNECEFLNNPDMLLVPFEELVLMNIC